MSRPTHCLPVELCQAHAVMAGELDHVNLWMPPRPELLGTRIVVQALPGDPGFWHWLLTERHGYQLPPLIEWQIKPGILGTVQLVGWARIHYPYRKILKQERAKGIPEFEGFKFSPGPVVWVFSKPKLGKHDGAGLKMLRAEYADQPQVRERDAAAQNVVP